MMVSAAPSCPSHGQPCAKMLVSDEAISPDFMDAQEGDMSCPQVFTGAGGTWAMAQSCEGCQGCQLQG